VAKRTHRRNISCDLAWLAHRLRIVGGEYELRAREFLQTEAHPMRAKVGGVVRPGPAGDIVIQAMVEIMVERLARAAAVTDEIRGAPFVARLKAVDTAEIAADTAGEMRELDFQPRQ